MSEPARRTRKRAADRKAEIVQAAIRLAAEIGPDRVTARHLGAAVGISQPAVFRHFPTMSDLWLAVGAAVARQLSEGEMAPGGDPLAALRAMVARHLRYVDRTPAIPAILFSRELHVENEEMRAHFDRVMANRRAGFARLVARAQAAGQLRPGVVPEDAGALILAAVQGLAVRWSLENRRFDLPAEGGRLIDGLIDGMRGPGAAGDGAAG